MTTMAFQGGKQHPVGTIFCIARNYVAHIAELNNTRPDKPVIFCKPITALNTGQTIVLPDYSEDVHYETELVVRLGKGGKNIALEHAADCIDGFALGLDLTARDVQSKLKEKGFPWELAKGFDGAACLSEFIPASAFADLTDIRFTMHFNGKLRQDGHTALMLFPIAEQIAFISRHFTLRAGDLVYTGTPEGVGKLAVGDTLMLTLGDHLLEHRCEVVA